MQLISMEEKNTGKTQPANGTSVFVSALGRGVRLRTSKQSVFDLARSVSGEDERLRSTLAGKPFETIRREAARAFARHGVQLSGVTLNDYAHSVADGRDYRFVVAY